MRTPPRLGLGCALTLLLGCGAAGPAPSPADFPSRSAAQPPFTLSWRIDRDAERVSAVGLVDVGGYVDRLMDVTVELEGLDPAGRVVSRASTLTAPRGFSGGRTWPVTVRLQPTRQEDRFAPPGAGLPLRIERTGGM